MDWPKEDAIAFVIDNFSSPSVSDKMEAMVVAIYKMYTKDETRWADVVEKD